MRRQLISLIASAMLLVAPMGALASQETDRLKMSKAQQRVYDASVALYGEENGVSHFLCSATVIASDPNYKNDYLLLTAGHCVTGGDLPTGLKFYIADTIVDGPVIQLDDRLTPVEVLKSENTERYDFALLEMIGKHSYPVIPVANRVPKIEDEIYTVNFSLGVTKQVALGLVATDVMTNKGSDNDCDICPGRYMVHIFAGPGTSGSSIVDAKTNEIVGISEFGFPGQTMGIGVETMGRLNEWLTSPQPSKSLSPKELALESPKAQ